MPMMLPKVAVITGGSRGIGAATAQLLAAQGFHIAILARNEAAAQTVAGALPGGGGGGGGGGGPPRHAAYTCDVGDAAAVQAAFQRVVAELGPVDVLVNAAGVVLSQLLLRTREADVDAVLRTNVLGTIHASRAALRSMLPRRRGCIVSIGSVVGLGGNEGQTAYSASKAALVAVAAPGFSRSLAKEVGRHGIRSNVVAAGLIDTDMTAGLTEQQRSRLLDGTALGRMGTPQEVAAAVAFLTQAEYVTGQVLYVDGGMAV